MGWTGHVAWEKASHSYRTVRKIWIQEELRAVGRMTLKWIPKRNGVQMWEVCLSQDTAQSHS